MRKIFVILMVWILIGARCKGELTFERNPSLELFLADSTNEISFYEPFYSPSGNKVYFIMTKKGNYDTVISKLCYIDLNSGLIDTLVRDSVITYTVSPNGNKIVYVKGKRRGFLSEVIHPIGAQKIVIINAFSGILIKEYSPPLSYIWHIEWSPFDSNIIAFTSSNSSSFYSLYFLNIETGIETLLIERVKWYTFTFDSISNKIIGDTSFYYPKLNPVWPQQILRSNFSPNDWPDDTEDIVLLNRRTGEEIFLNAKPYYWTSIPHASWSPDGKKIIFSAAKPYTSGEFIKFKRFELWILNLE